MTIHRIIASLCLAATCTLAAPLHAQTVIDEWTNAKLPAPPALKPAKLDAKETALFIMDMTNQTCTQDRRPRCFAAIPKVKKLLADARAKGVTVMFSVAGTGAKDGKDVVADLAPQSGEEVMPPLGPDKFIGSELEKTLKAKGIKTMIAIGTQAQTSVLHTAGEAALRGFKVVVPVDGATSDDIFPELYTVWHLANAARIGPSVTITKLDMISF